MDNHNKHNYNVVYMVHIDNHILNNHLIKQFESIYCLYANELYIDYL
jgi:hypothetical protein